MQTIFGPQFAIGERVTLNSGGPPMLVVDFVAGQSVVAWRDEDGVVEDTVPNVCLTPIQ